jgi:hypothetical protein
LTTAGSAVYRFVPGIGSHHYKAVFLGTNTYGASESTSAALTVTPPTAKIATNTTFASSGTAASYKFQASVSGNAGLATSLPASGVAFVDTNHSNQVLATAQLGPVATTVSWPTQSALNAASLVATADFNNDGNTDLLVQLSSYPSDLQVLFGNGDGTFTPGPDLGNYTPLGLVSDLNGDGIPDLIDYVDSATLLGNGDGTFTKVPSSIYLGPVLGLADFNHDGLPDLLIETNSGIRVLLGKGDGTFTNGPGFSFGIQPNVNSAIIGDFNGDGKPDAIVATSAHVFVLFGNGDGSFTKGLEPSGINLTSYSGQAVVCDLNQDGKADLAVPTYPGIVILLGNGDGTFKQAGQYQASYYNNPPLLFGDFNQDGNMDLLIGTQVLMNNGDGTFTLSVTNPGGYQTYTGPALVADFNGDGISDFAGTAYVYSPYGGGGYRAAGEVLQLTQVQQSASATATNVSIQTSPAHLVEASYPGDSNFASSVSFALPLGPPLAAILPASLNFGNQAVNTSSPVLTAILANIGGDPLAVNKIDITGTDSGFFAVSNKCTITMQSGQTCPVNLRFNPIALTSYSANLRVSDNAPGTPQLAPISGTGVNPQFPSVALSVSSLSFGSQAVNTASDAQTVSVTNTGNANLNIRSLVVTGQSPRSYPSSNNCGSQLAAGASCQVRVRFNPLVAQASSAAVTITDDAPNSPQKIMLSGTGTQGTLSLSDNLITFPNQIIGTSSFAYQVMLKNTGSAAVGISSIWWAGPNQTSFAVSNDCGASLSVSSSCTLRLRFIPTATAEAFAAVYITSTAGDPLVMQLRGTGVGAPAVSLSAASVAFGGTSGHSINEVQTVTMTNTGGSILPVQKIVVTGPNAAAFPSSNTCGAGIDAGASCTIRVRYIPVASGEATASILIMDGAANSPQHISLSGSNLPAAVTLSATSLGFADQLVNTTAPQQSLLLTNTGGAPLPITSISITGANGAYFPTGNTCNAMVKPGAYCVIYVGFTPLSVGDFHVTLSIVDGAPNSPQQIPVTGSGVLAPILSLSNNNLYFSQQSGSPTPVQQVILTNIGSATAHISSIDLSGAGASSFGTSIACGPTLAVKATCSILFSFDPKSGSTALAALTINSDADNSPQTIHLTGYPNQASYSLSATSLDFGSQEVGTAGPVQTITLTNTGTVTLYLSVYNPGGLPFVSVSTCSGYLVPKATCSIQASFYPIAQGPASGLLQVYGYGAAQNITLTGTGTGTP